MADVNTGQNAVLRMEAWVTGSNAAGNYSNFHWRLMLVERTPGSFGWSAGGIGASVEVFWDGGGYTVPWQGSFGYDFRPGGQQSVVIAEGDLNGMTNLANGAPRTFTFRGNMGNSGTSTAGGPASVDQRVAGATTIVTPGRPVISAATRVSDQQIDLSWTHSSAPNGQPYSNQVYRSVNGGAFTKILDIVATNAAAVGGNAPNQKIVFQVGAWNGAGFNAGGPSASSTPVYTTPAAPTAATATKNNALDIVVSFTPNVAYTEHTHEVWHGTVLDGVTTWDANPLATLQSGVTSYTHTAPNAAQVHIYRVRARAGALASGYSTTSAVQLLVAPNKPTITSLAQFANRAVPLKVDWVHNAQDTTPQTAYELQYSTNGGASWTSTGKVSSTASTLTLGTYPADTSLQVRVRTWGSATSGGADGAGASPWSTISTVVFKSLPVASILTPANGSVVNDATVRVTLGFSQPENATFVKAQLELQQAGVLVESVESALLKGITFTTDVENLAAYSVRARVLDSNGLWSAWTSSSFTVLYLPPATPVFSLNYLEDKGWTQINITVPDPGTGESAAVLVNVTRSIDNGPAETLVVDYPVSSELSFFDTVPSIHGNNTYTVSFTSLLGAKSSASQTLVTEECRRAFLSKGNGYSTVVAFGGNLSVDEDREVANRTVQAAGRTKPIGLYGVETSVQLKVSSRVFENFGATPDELRAFLVISGRACYRDSTGRRVFGAVTGSYSYDKVKRGNFKFNMTETS